MFKARNISGEKQEDNSMSTIPYSDSPTNPVTGDRGENMVPAPINGADYRIIKDEPGEAVLINTSASSPVTYPEKVRIAVNEIPDVFKGSDIEAGLQQSGMIVPGSKKGLSILIQTTGAMLDSGNALFPYSAHLVMKLPKIVDLDASNVVTIVERLLGQLFETGEDNATNRLDSLLRGAVKPAGL